MTSLRRKFYFLLAFSCVPLLWSCSLAGVIPCLKPGDKAPGFSIQTTEGLLSYNTDRTSDIKGPLVVVAFTNESGFLENLFGDPKKMVSDLFDHSPDNAHYLFLFYDNAALGQSEGASKRLQMLLIYEMYAYFNKKWLRYNKEMQRVQTLSNYRRKNMRSYTFLRHWKSKLHFATFPVHMLGNWIPRVLSQWYCSGPFCGLDQIAIENQNGDVLKVFRRLDARYTWLPSLKKLTTKKKRFLVVYVLDACANVFTVVVKGALALVYSGQGKCSTFAKIKNAQTNGALGVIVYSKPRDYLEELNCHQNECETDLTIPATMIHNEDGFGLREAVPGGTYARFQTTPSDMFTFGIDGQGRVRETSWSLYPSTRFLGYHAQWFNYVTDATRNETGDARLISIFKDHLIQSTQGITTDITIPDYWELKLYQNVEVNMSLTCPKTGPDACTHWDHVIKLLVSCDPSKKPGQELARWIMAYGRRTSSWITPVRAVLPLLKANSTTSNKCSFTVITEASVMPWIVTVNLRLSEKIKRIMNFTTWRQIEKNLVPVEIVDLFTGCFFDENCNKKYTTPKLFKVPKKVARVKLVATITGHGRDNNNCARACLTTHRFIINKSKNSTKTRVLKNTGSAPSCVNDFSDPNNPMNSQKMWLRGRHPWCDGQEVVPWEVDVTSFIRFGAASNFIEYRAFYNGTDPRPTQDPGTIVMSSYLVYYVYEDLV